jgi:hypothetical protein
MTEREIFIEALDTGSPDERASFLDAACAGDAALRGRIEALLRSHEEAGGFLHGSAPERLAGLPGVKVLVGETRTGPSQPDGDIPLDFLDPSDKLGSIGRLRHYEVREVVGRGGMGVVLKAFDESLHRVVAIKVMAPQLATSATARKRFTREARAQAAVTHDHVVTIHAVEDSGPLPHIVMQFVAGQSLQDRLDRSGPVPLAEILRIGMQAAAGLAAAHAQGLVHRDVKPANILLENGVERVKLTDFGLARAADDASLTQSGTVAGTPAFMSPEQAEGRSVDHRSDLFCLGSVLYAMCTGRPPFRANTSMAVLKRVCEETPTPIRDANSEVPDWLAEIVTKLHAKDPAARFQSAAEVADLLGRHLARVQHPSVVPFSAVAKAAGRPPSPGRPTRRHRLAVAAAALVATLAVLGTTEATGVTNVRATVVRIFTPEGTLVVETDDPGVKVVVEGDGDLVITGAGPQEVRLRAGSYRLKATRDGKPVKLDRDLVAISRGDRQIVRVRMEDEPAAAVLPKAESGAFVLLGGKGVAERKFDTLAEAVPHASDGDTIEIRGNGPFVSEPVTISNGHALTIRAGTGFRPVLRLSRGAVEDQHHLLLTNGPVVLEGLDVWCERRAGAKSSETFTAVCALGGRVHVANCRFVAPYRHSVYAAGSRRAVVVNCEFLGSIEWFDGLTGACAAAGVWEVENCVQVGGALVSCGANSPDARDARVRVRRCSLTSCQPVYCYFNTMPRDTESGEPARLVHLEVTDTVFGTTQLLGAAVSRQFREQKNPLQNATPREALSRLVRWHGSNNVHDPMGTLIFWGTESGAEQVEGVSDLPTWRKFWSSPETGSIEGQIRFQGGDLAGRSTDGAQKLSPEDFRLRHDSAGYRAGKGGNDLGADVDLVGPGAAYERWKRTPGYQQWLKDTGQIKK